MNFVKNPLGEQTLRILQITMAINLPNSIISTFAANPPIVHQSLDSPAAGQR